MKLLNPLIVALSLAWASPSLAQAPPDPTSYLSSEDGQFALYGIAGISHRASGDFDLFSTKTNIRQGGLGATVDVWQRPSLLSVAVEADWARELAGSNGVLDGNFRSRFKQHSVTLGPSVRYTRWGFIAPFAKTFAIATANTLRLRNEITATTYRVAADKQFGVGLSGGFLLRSPSLTPRGKGLFPILSLGLRVEAGYSWISSQPFELSRANEPEYAIEGRRSSLGSLDLNAAFARIAVVIRL